MRSLALAAATVLGTAVPALARRCQPPFEVDVITHIDCPGCRMEPFTVGGTFVAS